MNINYLELFSLLLILIPWFTGVSLASGFWQTFFSIVFAPYAWYLVIKGLGR